MTTPTVIGPYRVERLLGTGGFATVWLAYDPGLDARVAVKVLADNWSRDPQVRERFIAEGRLLWQLDDERLVRVHGVGELEDGRPYVVMAWADRGSLADRLAAEAPDVVTAVGVLRAVADGVAVLHRRRIVHRDLTPGNVLLRSRPDGSEQVLVADLGLAKSLATASGLTLGVGTPGYAAPEQLRSVTVVDERADVYALGRLGRALLPGLAPGPLDDLLTAATDPDPERRPADADAFLGLLAAAAPPTEPPGGPGRAAPPTAEVATPRHPDPTPEHRRPSRRVPARAAVPVALAVVLGVVGVLVADRLLPGSRTASAGPLSVALPAGWTATGTEWSAATTSNGRTEPALIIATDPTAWSADPSVPGAFVALSSSLERAGTTAAQYVAGRRHGTCAAPAPASWKASGGAVWSVATFPAACAGGRVFVEAATDQPEGLVYVQLALPRENDATVRAVLEGLRLS